MKRHYIYRLEHIETKEFYWGSRSCNCEPKDDPYMGSMKTWKPDKIYLVKTDIIEYNSREEAYKAEEVVITYFIDKKKFPLNRNYHTTKNFSNYGNTHSQEARAKISKAKKGKTPPNKGKPNSQEARAKISKANRGKTRSQETKDKMSIRIISQESKDKRSKSNKGNTRPLKRNIYYNGEFVYYSVGDFKEFCKMNNIYMEGFVKHYKKGLPYEGYTVEIINKK